LANSLHAVEKVTIVSTRLNANNLSLALISKVAPCQGNGFSAIIYNPTEAPQDRVSFEECILKAVKANSKLEILEIGHENWHKNQHFQLSLDFCKSLVDNTPAMKHLELSNVRDVYPQLNAYLLRERSGSCVSCPGSHLSWSAH